MQNLNFDDGFKEFTINNDPSKVIRFNPADFGIIERISTAYQKIQTSTEVKEDIELNPDGSPMELVGKVAEVVKGIADTVKAQIDYIFNSPVSEVVFGNQSPLGMVKGVPMYERFLNAVVPLIKKEVESEMAASQKRVSKYTSMSRNDVIKGLKNGAGQQ
jgi:hypothetical protein